MENRSTSPPISAILITADSPASPPPITMILGVAILLHRPSVAGGLCARFLRGMNRGMNHGAVLIVVRQRARPERIQTRKPRRAQHQEKRQAHAQQPLLRLVARHNPPFRREQPDPIREVPRSRHQSHYIEQEQSRVHYLMLDLRE